MATSGTNTLQLTRNEIIEAALRKLSVLEEGETPSATTYTNGAQALNTLIAQFRTLGMPLWKRTETTFSLTSSVSTYQIGVGKTIDVPYPLKMLQAFRTETSHINLDIISRANFNLLPSNSSGTPTQLTYQPFINYGEIKIWPTPDSDAASDVTITVVYQKPFDYFTSSTETLDFPEEWYLAVIYNLAVLLASEWSIPLQDRQSIKAEATEYLNMVLTIGMEDTSLYIQPNYE